MVGTLGVTSQRYVSLPCLGCLPASRPEEGDRPGDPAYSGTMAEAKPLSIAIYRRGPAWVNGKELREQPTLLDHGGFLAGLERAHQAIHAGPAHRLDDVPSTDPIGMASFPCSPDQVPALLRDDPGLVSGLLECEILAWHVADAG
jgi:hypothetical protein